MIPLRLMALQVYRSMGYLGINDHIFYSYIPRLVLGGLGDHLWPSILQVKDFSASYQYHLYVYVHQAAAYLKNQVTNLKQPLEQGKTMKNKKQIRKIKKHTQKQSESGTQGKIGKNK